MSDEPSFRLLWDRLRRGDPTAAEELLRQYETELRIIVRVRLRDPRLRRTLETMDICQSVLADFFVRAALGQFDLESPEQLKKLLAQMVRNQVTDQARRANAARRDVGRLAPIGVEELPLAGRAETPSQIVANQELLARLQQLLGPAERAAVELRRGGASWDSVAAQQGGTPEAARKRVQRAIEAAAQQLGLQSLDRAADPQT